MKTCTGLAPHACGNTKFTSGDRALFPLLLLLLLLLLLQAQKLLKELELQVFPGYDNLFAYVYCVDL
jgi:hypothetical protein